MCDHPNLWLTPKARETLDAAKALVDRMRAEGGYSCGSPYVLYLPNKTLLETMASFTVGLVDGSRQYWVTPAGFIGVERDNREHLDFLDVNGCDAAELDAINTELQRRIPQPAST